MLAEAKILVNGYTSADSATELGEEKTCATISLVRDGDMIMVVDPGVLESQQILIDALNKEGLTISDVNVVCITHSHIDHYLNAGMFPNAKILEFFGLWDKNTVQEWNEQFSPNVKILKTPGHDYTSITVFAKTKEGIVAICGDVFWKENFPKNPEDDIYASDHERLKESRRKVLELADWVIPGHSGIYKKAKN
jgi:glyoxylase-like metal-dependent hydrolase (beta-lactamase superfamily II)